MYHSYRDDGHTFSSELDYLRYQDAKHDVDRTFGVTPDRFGGVPDKPSHSSYTSREEVDPAPYDPRRSGTVLHATVEYETTKAVLLSSPIGKFWLAKSLYSKPFTVGKECDVLIPVWMNIEFITS